jgi:hypothetical protein
LDEIRDRQKRAKAEPDKEHLRRPYCDRGGLRQSDDKSVHGCFLNRVDGGFATPHHQACRMKRGKLVVIFAKNVCCLLE